MRQATDHIACASREIPTAMLEWQTSQERQKQQSNLAPNRYIACAFAAVYCTIVVVASGLVGVWRRARATAIHRQLAELFYYVPEMAVHKAIELEAFLRRRYQGCGVDL